MKNIKVTIDKKEVEVKQGTTILMPLKVSVLLYPHYVIYTSKILITNRPAGCRICVVEVEGRRVLHLLVLPNAPKEWLLIHTTLSFKCKKTALELILSDQLLISLLIVNCNITHEFGIREIEYYANNYLKKICHLQLRCRQMYHVQTLRNDV